MRDDVTEVLRERFFESPKLEWSFASPARNQEYHCGDGIDAYPRRYERLNDSCKRSHRIDCI